MKDTAMASQSISKMRITVWLLEQNDLAALYLQQILSRCTSFTVTRLTDTTAKNLQAESNNVVVIDKATLPLPFSQCLKSVQISISRAGILVLDHPRSRREILELISHGVLGFVSYPDVEELGQAIKSISQKQLWLKAEAIDTRPSLNTLPVSTDWRYLTCREHDVIELLQRKLSNKEISMELHISESTVKFHLANIFSKLGLRDRFSVSKALELLPIRTRELNSKPDSANSF